MCRKFIKNVRAMFLDEAGATHTHFWLQIASFLCLGYTGLDWLVVKYWEHKKNNKSFKWKQNWKAAKRAKSTNNKAKQEKSLLNGTLWENIKSHKPNWTALEHLTNKTDEKPKMKRRRKKTKNTPTNKKWRSVQSLPTAGAFSCLGVAVVVVVAAAPVNFGWLTGWYLWVGSSLVLICKKVLITRII